MPRGNTCGVDELIEDLAAEVAALGAVVAGLDDEAWTERTPAPGWDVGDQIVHLVMFDERCAWGIADPARFEEDLAVLGSRGGMDAVHSALRAMPRTDLTQRWLDGAADLRETGRAADPKARCRWYGPSMSAKSMLTARLMETWAHGYDICDTVGAVLPATDRLRHVAHIAVNARPFAYATNKRQPPAADVRVELTAPSGAVWTWGESTTDMVRGGALGFCLAATQRRHVDDCGLEVTGDGAREWMSIVQAFAGPPGAGRTKGQFDTP